jgi:hypothetical protein
VKRVAVLAFALLWVAVPAAAQVPTEESEDLVISEVDASAYPQIAMTVAPPRLLAPAELGADAFTVAENNENRPVTVTRLANEALHIALVLDTSLPPEVFRDAQGAALDFVLELPTGTRVTVVRAGETPQVVLPSTTDLASVTTAIGNVALAPGRAMYDAILLADSELRTSEQARRTVLLFTGGRDTKSAASLAAVTQRLASSGTSLYAVELTGGDDAGALASVAANVGGRSVEASSSALVGAYQRVAEVLLNQYQVTFQATSRGRARVDVRVVAEGFSGERSLAVQLTPDGRTATSSSAAPTTERGGGRAVVEPLAAGLTIAVGLLFGGLLVALGRAGLRGARAADELLTRDPQVAGVAKTTTLSR